MDTIRPSRGEKTRHARDGKVAVGERGGGVGLWWSLDKIEKYKNKKPAKGREEPRER